MGYIEALDDLRLFGQMQAFSEFLYLGFAAEEYCRYIVRDEVEEDFFVALLRDRYRDLLFILFYIFAAA